MTVAVDRDWFKKCWERKGLTLTKTAKLIGMDPSALSRTLAGERKMKLAEVGKIATILDVTAAEVFSHMERDLNAAPSGGELREGNAERISQHPGFGFMKGMIKIEEGFDVTGPFNDEAWDEGYLGEDRL